MTENIAVLRNWPSSPGAHDWDQFRKTPSNCAPRASIALRERSLRASVLRSTRNAHMLEGMLEEEKLGLNVDPGALCRSSEPSEADLHSAKFGSAGPNSGVPIGRASHGRSSERRI